MISTRGRLLLKEPISLSFTKASLKRREPAFFLLTVGPASLLPQKVCRFSDLLFKVVVHPRIFWCQCHRQSPSYDETPRR